MILRGNLLLLVNTIYYLYVSAERGIIFVKLWFALAPLVYVNIVSEDEYEDLAKKKRWFGNYCGLFESKVEML